MVIWSIGLSAVAILISGLSVHWSREAAAINREIARIRADIERIRAERRAMGLPPVDPRVVRVED